MSHSNIGPSGSHRWMNCPSSPNLCKGMPDKTSPYAAHGIAVHEVCEISLIKKHDADVLVGATMTNGITIEPDDAVAAQIFIDFVRSIYGGMADPEPLSVEHRFDLNWIMPGMFGTADAVVREMFNKLYVIDYKNGSGVNVEAKDNSQAMYYGLGALGEGNQAMYEEVVLVIVQPRVFNADPIKTWSLPADDLMTWGLEVLKPAAEATTKPDAPFCAGSWCKFCRAKPICPALKSKALSVARQAFDVDITAGQVSLPSPAQLSEREIADVLDFQAMLKPWMDACKEYAIDRMRAGAKIPGRKLVRGKASRKWNSDAAVIKRLNRKIKKSQLWTDPKLKSPAKMEALLKKEKIDPAILVDLIEITRGISLVSADDKRKALPNAASVFTQGN